MTEGLLEELPEEGEELSDRELLEAIRDEHNEVVFRDDGIPSRADFCGGCPPGDEFLPCDTRTAADLALRAMDLLESLPRKLEELSIDRARAELGAAMHESYCWTSGRPTKDGYVWTYQDHPVGHGKCDDALETALEYAPRLVRLILEGEEK